MIAAAELRIGNWVNYHYAEEDACGNMLGYSDPIEVEEIIFDGINLSSSECAQFKYSELTGIPITSDIMASCGFAQSGNEYWDHYRLPDGWSISEWLRDDRPAGFEEKGVYYWGDPYVPVRWLHQLQNLYFALTGKELICNL